MPNNSMKIFAKCSGMPTKSDEKFQQTSVPSAKMQISLVAPAKSKWVQESGAGPLWTRSRLAHIEPTRIILESRCQPVEVQDISAPNPMPSSSSKRNLCAPLGPRAEEARKASLRNSPDTAAALLLVATQSYMQLAASGLSGFSQGLFSWC